MATRGFYPGAARPLSLWTCDSAVHATFATLDKLVRTGRHNQSCMLASQLGRSCVTRFICITETMQ